jgi:hypothetical protein
MVPVAPGELEIREAALEEQEMDPMNALLVSKTRMAERQAEAAEDRLARLSRCPEEPKSAVRPTVSEAACSWFDRLIALIRRALPARVALPRL